MSQKRYHARVATSLPVSINKKDTGVILNMGAGGALISTEALLHNEDIIGLNIDLPSGPLSVLGIVVREEGKAEYGVQFVNLSVQEKVFIIQYMFRFCR